MTEQDMAVPPEGAGQGAPKCGARKRSGPGRCGQAAGWGTDHPGIGNCRRHLGSSPNHRKAANEEKARLAVETYGLPREIDPADALLEEVWRTAGHVAWLEGKVRELQPDDLVWGKTEEHDKGATEFTGQDVKYQAVPNVWLDLYRAERKHLMDICKVTIAAGVAERQVKLAERMGGQLVSVMTGIFTRLGMDPSDPRLRQAIGDELALQSGAPVAP